MQQRVHQGCASRVCSKGAARVCSRGSGRLLEVGLAQLVRPVQQRLAHHGAHARVVVRLGAGAPLRRIEGIYQSVRLCQSPPHSYQRRGISIVALLECLYILHIHVSARALPSRRHLAMRFCFHRPLSPHTPFHRATCRSSSPLAMLRARAHPWLWSGLERLGLGFVLGLGLGLGSVLVLGFGLR